MEHLIAIVAFSIITVGLIASIFGLIQFTRCFGNTPQAPPSTAAKPFNSADNTRTPE